MHEPAHGVMGQRQRTRLRHVRSGVFLFGALGLAGCTGVAAAGPEPGVAPGYGYTCYAGAYVCRLHEQVPVGAQCTCPGIGAASYGTVR